MNDESSRKMAQLLKELNFEGKPVSEVGALGMLMEQWLKQEISDNGKSVDTGAGFDCYDLWVEVGGVELFISIQKSKKQLAREGVEC